MVFIKIEPYIRKQIFIAACLNTGHLVVGFGVSWTAPLLPKLQNIEESPLAEVISPKQASLVGSLIYVGSFAGLLTGYISNNIGRRKSLMLGDVFNLIAYILLTWPTNLTMIYVGRVLVGYGMTFIGILDMVYIGEITPPNLRGIILASTGVFHGLGALLVVSTGPFLKYHQVGYIAIAIIIIHFLGCFYIPESPVYHVIKGDENSARQVLQRLKRDKDIDTELKAMVIRVQEQQNSGKLSELFTHKTNRKAFIICLALMVIQQTNGMIAVLFFATSIFEQTGSYIRADISTIIINLTSLFGFIVAPIFVEKCGRKVLLIASCVCCCLAMILLGTYFYLDLINSLSVTYIRWLPLVSLIAALFTYGIGLGIIPNTIQGEMFKSNMRSIGASSSMSIGWMIGFLAATAFGYMVVALGNHTTFWIFAIVNAAGLLFIVFYVPETKGKSLVDIEDMLEK